MSRLALAILFITTIAAHATELSESDLRKLYAQSVPGYTDADFAKLLHTHRLLESYFSSTTNDARRFRLNELAALDLPLEAMARLCPLHLDWPDLAPGGVYYVNEPVDAKRRVRYFLGLPPTYSRLKPFPLAIHLPKADAFLPDPRPDADTVARIYTAWIQDELKKHPNAIVVMPLLNLDEFWGPSQPGVDTVILPLLHAPSKVHIDPARVYLLGHGMSAHAVWNIGLHYPTYFAALEILAGSATQDHQRLRLPSLRNTLPVIWHDANDPIIPVRRTRSIVTALRALKIPVEYDETRSAGHIPTDLIVDRAYSKVVTRTRDLYPAHVTLQTNRLEAPFRRVDWLELLESSRPGDDEKLVPQHGSAPVVVYKNVSRLDATLDKERRRIDVIAENVASFRLHLAPDMLDLSKPLVVVVNNRSRFEGVVTPTLESLLTDQLALGRGWRAFTAQIDIVLSP